MTKSELFAAGLERMAKWCALNSIALPRVEVTAEPSDDFGTCAYYRDSVIYIWPPACAAIGRAGRAWSYPGHSVDRTPFGVIQHELGHHVDHAHGNRLGSNGYWRWQQQACEKPLTGYRGDQPNEWFAEMFRLFVTNPDLLRVLRPKTHARMSAQWQSVETRPWDVVLAGAERQMAVIRKRIAA